MEKKTHKQWLSTFKLNKNIKLLTKFVSSHTKIKCQCKIDGHEWEARPHNLSTRGSGCPKCSGYSHKTHEEWLSSCKLNKNIELITTYVNSSTKIKCRCKIDGHEWEAMPNSLSRGSGCRKCQKRKSNKSPQEFKEKLFKINPQIEVLCDYYRADIKIKCRCKIDGLEWEARPHSLLRGIGCPKCGNVYKKTHKEWLSSCKLNKNIELLSKYKSFRTKIKCRCKIDGHEWEAMPHNLSKGSGCRKCRTRNKSKIFS